MTYHIANAQSCEIKVILYFLCVLLYVDLLTTNKTYKSKFK